MGRLSQFFWAINADSFPSKSERKFYYTNIDLSGKQGDDIKRVRRQRRQAVKATTQPKKV